MRRVFVAALSLLALALVACGDDQESGGKPVAAATAPQLDVLVRELAGEGVQVATIVPATADIHDLELRPSQVRALRDADLIVRPGRDGDRWAAEALDAADAEQLDASAGLPGEDRHWWMDAAAAADAAAAIAGSLDAIDPAGKTARAAALRTLQSQLRAVDAQTKRCLASVPEVTDHDAVGAFARRYGLRVAATIAPGSDPEAAPSAKRLVELLETIERERVAAVFAIAPHGGEIVETIAQRAGITLGEPLWADALPGASDEHEHEHAGEDHAAEDAHAEDGEHATEAGTDVHGAEPLIEAARRNAHAVAAALGAKPAACGELLS